LCTCLARVRPDILYVLGGPTNSQATLTPTPPNVIQFIEFTYCHDIFPNTAHNEKIARYNPRIQALRTTGWQVNPLITIIVDVKGSIHKQPIRDLENSKHPKM
jgi:hypothetical protein